MSDVLAVWFLPAFILPHTCFRCPLPESLTIGNTKDWPTQHISEVISFIQQPLPLMNCIFKSRRCKMLVCEVYRCRWARVLHLERARLTQVLNYWLNNLKLVWHSSRSGKNTGTLFITAIFIPIWPLKKRTVSACGDEKTLLFHWPWVDTLTLYMPSIVSFTMFAITMHD